MSGRHRPPAPRNARRTRQRSPTSDKEMVPFKYGNSTRLTRIGVNQLAFVSILILATMSLMCGLRYEPNILLAMERAFASSARILLLATPSILSLMMDSLILCIGSIFLICSCWMLWRISSSIRLTTQSTSRPRASMPPSSRPLDPMHLACIRKDTPLSPDQLVRHHQACQQWMDVYDPVLYPIDPKLFRPYQFQISPLLSTVAASTRSASSAFRRSSASSLLTTICLSLLLLSFCPPSTDVSAQVTNFTTDADGITRQEVAEHKEVAVIGPPGLDAADQALHQQAASAHLDLSNQADGTPSPNPDRLLAEQLQHSEDLRLHEANQTSVQER